MTKRFFAFHSLSSSAFLRAPALLLTTFLLLISASCTFNPSFQSKGVADLQGEWQQDTSAVQKKLVSYTLYHYKFDCDSFFVQMKTFSKTNYGADTCMSKGHWAEYAKGNYTLRHDTLRLIGLFATAKYDYKEAGGCFRSGNYEEHFTIAKKTDSLYLFTNTSGLTPFNVRLIKKTTCNPKAL